MSGLLQVIVGGQYGSEAKGHVAGYLAKRDQVHLAIRVAGPNAGHSVVDPTTGQKYALRQIPAAAVTAPDCRLAIAAGSEIDFSVLQAEIEALEAGGIKVRQRLVIDDSATVLTADHVYREHTAALTQLCGSTSKGIGAARADRIWRRAKVARDVVRGEYETGSVGQIASPLLRQGLNVQVEGAQGYGLGLHGPHYPFSTSADCTALDVLAQARISPWAVAGPGKPNPQVWVVFRPYPIRVAGNSGPMYEETSWEALGLPPEYTTVTRKMRRVGQWDPKLATEAMWANGCARGQWTHLAKLCPVRVALTMVDQLDPALAGTVEPDLVCRSSVAMQFIERVYDDIGHRPDLVTTSDRTAVSWY